MKIRNIDVDVDVKAELEQFNWEKATWKDDRLIANSPMRIDSSPSFFVRLKEGNGYEEGIWGDSGAIDDYYSSGTFPKLLAFLRNETIEETENYLLEMYGEEVGYRKLELRLDFKEDKTLKILPKSKIEDLPKTYTYLNGRGISDRIQDICDVRYDEKQNCILIPWFNSNGELCNIKYRKIGNKFFWYEKEGTPIGDLIWGMNFIYKHKCEYAVITEAEIDSMTLMTYGIPSIAIGGASLSKKKEELLIKSPLKRLYVATDNDETGFKIKRQIISKLSIYKDIYSVYIPNGYKDINDIRDEEKIKKILKNAKKEQGLSLNF